MKSEGAPVRVLKFGGSSVGTPERIRRVASIIQSYKKSGEQVVVVVSAMGDTTDDLIELAKKVSPQAEERSHRREMDMLLTTGERISMALLSMALADLGLNAISLTGSQSGIITSAAFGEALIKEIRPIRIREALAQNKIVIVAGFQGVSPDKEITTLGRGGSDTSAVALGIALEAEYIAIYTDVDGFFSADPRKVPSAKKIEEIPWGLAVEAASRGAQVLHARCVELAWKFKLPIYVCSSFVEQPEFACANMKGTVVFNMENQSLESSKVLSISSQSNLILARVPECKSIESIHGFLSQEYSSGRIPLRWELRFDGLLLLIEHRNRQMLQGQAQVSATSDLLRVSMIGVGLDRDVSLLSRLAEILRAEHIEAVEVKQSATVIDLLVESSKVKDERKLLQALHEEFIK